MKKDKAVEKGIEYFKKWWDWKPDVIKYVEEALQITAKEKEKEQSDYIHNLKEVEKQQIYMNNKLKKENEELKKEILEVRKCNESELGVCREHCDIFKDSIKKQTIKEVIEKISNVTWSFLTSPKICSICNKEVFVISDEFNKNVCYRCALKKFENEMIK